MSNTKPGFQVIRKQNYPAVDQTDALDASTLTADAVDGFTRLAEVGMYEGSTLKLVFSMPELSVIHCWFRSGFPLPLHSHDADCLYYIIAGEVRLGTEVIGEGDSFYVPSDVPYGYSAGPAGVELLEIRTKDKFNIKSHVKAKAGWDHAHDAMVKNHPKWAQEPRPSRA